MTNKFDVDTKVERTREDADVAAFNKRMSVSWSQLAREEIASGKRWNLLQAVAYIAAKDEAFVDEVRTWCPSNLALPHHNHALSASIHLTRDLTDRRSTNNDVLSVEAASRVLLSGLTSGDVCAYVNAKATLLTGLEFREIVYASNHIGLAPTPAGDERYWQSVFVEAADIRRLVKRAPEESTNRMPSMPPGAKRGPKPKWDWLNLMGELVRIADQDGIESIGAQADVERWAAAWLARKAGSDEGPSESLVREHIAPIFDAIDCHNERKRSR